MSCKAESQLSSTRTVRWRVVSLCCPGHEALDDAPGGLLRRHPPVLRPDARGPRPRRATRAARRRHEPRKILFIELSEMGSTIIASAMIRRVQKRYRDAEHCFCIFKKNAASLRLLGLFREECIFTHPRRFARPHGDRRLALHGVLPARADRHGDRSGAVLADLLAPEPALGGHHAGRLSQLPRRGTLPRRAPDPSRQLQRVPPHVAELHGAGGGARDARGDPESEARHPAAAAAGPGAARARGVRVRPGRAAALLPADRPAQSHRREPRRRRACCRSAPGRASVSSR